MKRLFRLVFFFFLPVCGASDACAQHGDTTQVLYGFTYSESSSEIRIDNRFVTISGWMSCFKKELEHKLFLPGDEYGMCFFKGKWRAAGTPVYNAYSDTPENNVRWINILNYLDDSAEYRMGHDHISLMFRVCSKAWIDTLDRSKRLLLVDLVTNDSARVFSALNETDACVGRGDFEAALRAFEPIHTGNAGHSPYVFFDYYHDWLRYNLLSALPGTFCELIDLKKLSLQYNLLEQLPENMGNLYFLEELSLIGNPLKKAPPVGSQPYLRSICLCEKDRSLYPQNESYPARDKVVTFYYCATR